MAVSPRIGVMSSQGGRRRYYQITARGKKVYSENKDNWEYAKRVLDNLL